MEHAVFGWGDIKNGSTVMLRLATAIALSLAFSAPVLAKNGSGAFSSHKSYKVSGTATVSGTSLKLTGFQTSSGPDLYVYVGNGGPSKLVAKLKADSGSQNYTLPAGNWSTVHIHCKRFNSTFGTAQLN